MRIYGKPLVDFTLEQAVKLGVAIGRAAGSGNLVISGRDYARVSRMLKRAVTAGVMSTGADVMDFHESLIGEISFAIKRFGARMGFMVSLDPVSRGILLRIFSSPGYELVGRKLDTTLSTEASLRAETNQIGWIYYAEYMHRLYVAALSSFIKSDLVSSRRPSVIVGPSVEPLGTILSEISNSVGVDQTIIGGADIPEHPNIELMDKIGKVSDALSTSIGVAFSHDGSQLSLYTPETGYTIPEELVLTVLSKYPTSKIITYAPILKSLVRHLDQLGYDIIVLDSEEEFHELVRKERPPLAFTWRGEFITPVFSLGFDSLTLYVQVLEMISDRGDRLINDIKAIRSRMNHEYVELNAGLELCREYSGNTTLWGCRILKNNKVYTLIYQHKTRGFTIYIDEPADITKP